LFDEASLPLNSTMKRIFYHCLYIFSLFVPLLRKQKSYGIARIKQTSPFLWQNILQRSLNDERIANEDGRFILNQLKHYHIL
jgi:hypothetical protein